MTRFRITMLYNKEPERTIVATTDGPTTWGWVGRDMALTVGGQVTIESVTGPPYEAGEDRDMYQDDWDQLLDGMRPARIDLYASEDGWTLDLGTNDLGVGVSIETSVEEIEN